MTRINLVPPSELCDQHLLSEWRELTRIPNRVARNPKINLDTLPTAYTVRTNANPKGGEGHCRFFYNKLLFLRDRYQALLEELAERELPQEDRWPFKLPGFPQLWQGYEPTPEAIELNRQRIKEQMPAKPRYCREYL